MLSGTCILLRSCSYAVSLHHVEGHQGNSPQHIQWNEALNIEAKPGLANQKLSLYQPGPVRH